MNKTLISFIIPIYNSEKYIERLVDSILNQKIENIEIILVNDGSTDNTKEILKQYEGNNLIKVINKENSGVSSTRNLGLKEASGKYIMFSDSDDYYKKGSIKKIIKQLDEKSDLIIFSCCREDENLNITELFKQEDKIIPAKKNLGIEGYLLNNFENKYGNCIWNKIYKLDIIRKNNIKFCENQTIAEDLLFNVEYFEKIKNYKTVSTESYVYCYNANSITRRYSNKYLDEYIKTSNNLNNILENENYHDRYYALLMFYFGTYNYIFNNETLSNSKKTSLERLKKYFNNYIIKEALKNVKIKRFNFKNKIKYIITKLNLYGLIYNLMILKERLRKLR